MTMNLVLAMILAQAEPATVDVTALLFPGGGAAPLVEAAASLTESLRARARGGGVKADRASVAGSPALERLELERRGWETLRKAA